MLSERESDFAKTCLERGITVLDSSANKERSKLIAKQKGLDNSENIDELQFVIDAYIEENNEKERAKKNKLLNDKKNEELQRKEELEKYADDFGREKTIHYLEDLIANVQFTIDQRDAATKSANDIKKAYAAAGVALKPLQSPPEQDWALAGGFASALAGPAAGVAVATDIQRKNAEAKIDSAEAGKEAQKIKDNWKMTGDSLAKRVIDNSGVSVESYKTAKKRKTELIRLKEKCEVLLVDEAIDQYQLLGMLAPTTETITVSETGLVHITVRITGRTYAIFDNIPAVIDGSFKALLWNEKGECCGTAAIVLPIHGAQDSSLLEAWFTTSTDNGIGFVAEFTKPNLWLVEALKEQGTEDFSKIDPTEIIFSRKAENYYDAYELMNSLDIAKLKRAIELFEVLDDWKDSNRQKHICQERVKQLTEQREKERLQKEIIEEAKRAQQIKAEQQRLLLVKKKKRNVC